jgi:hypothetical protein
VVIDRLPLSAAPEVHTRIDAGGLGGKIVLTPGRRSWVTLLPLWSPMNPLPLETVRSFTVGVD